MPASNKILNDFEVDSEPVIKTKEIHYIPAKIEANQDASIETKFSYRHSEDSPDVLEVELRGRPLNGQKIKLPEGYQGFIGNSKNTPRSSDKGENKTYRIVSQFDEYVYWNWDQKPTANDSHVKLLDWLNVAEVLHSPVSPDN